MLGSGIAYIGPSPRSDHSGLKSNLRTGDVAWLVESLLIMHEALGLILSAA